MPELTPEQREREIALDAVLRMTIGNESVTCPDVVDYACYIISGERPVVPPLRAFD